MKNNKISGILIVLGLSFFMTTANACTRKAAPSAANQIIPERRINEALFDRAVLAEVNYHRCRAGLKPLRSEKRLINAAKGHSRWMARAREVTHHSNVSGRRELGDRIRRTGMRYKAGAENIGKVYRFQLRQQPFFVSDIAACQFTKPGGIAIPQHSYQSLARYIVNLWVQSPGHRTNIMDRRMTKLGSALALDKTAAYCGTFYVTQTFAG